MCVCGSSVCLDERLDAFLCVCLAVLFRIYYTVADWHCVNRFKHTCKAA